MPEKRVMMIRNSKNLEAAQSLVKEIEDWLNKQRYDYYPFSNCFVPFDYAGGVLNASLKGIDHPNWGYSSNPDVITSYRRQYLGYNLSRIATKLRSLNNKYRTKYDENVYAELVKSSLYPDIVIFNKKN